MAVRVADTIEPMGEGSYPVVAATNVSGLATVATTGDYNDLINTPGGGGGTNSEYAQKIGTSQSHPAIGSASLPVYVNSSGAVTPITELEVAGSHLIPAQTGIVDHSSNIYDAAWSTYRNAWECGYPTPLTVATDWTVDRATIIIGGTEYYVLMSDFANGNLNNYCPNATSYTTGTWAPILNISDDLPVSGMCLQKQNSGNILLWIDTVIYTGEGTRPDIILSSDYINTQTTTEAGPAKITTPILESSIEVTAPKLKKTEYISDSYRLNLQDYDGKTIVYDLQAAIIQESGCYMVDPDSYNLWLSSSHYGCPMEIAINYTTYKGVWYEAGTGPGYGTLFPSGIGNQPYCYFTEHFAVMEYYTSEGDGRWGLIFACDAATYNSMSSGCYWILYPKDGLLEVHGAISVVGSNDVNEYQRGKMEANRIRCHNTTIAKDDNLDRYIEATTILYPRNSFDWSLQNGCYQYGYPHPLIDFSDWMWAPELPAEFICYDLRSDWLYADKREVASVDLQTYCPNATSTTIEGFPFKYYDYEDEGRLKVMPGMCMARTSNGYCIYFDATIYPSTSSLPIPDIILESYGELRFRRYSTTDPGIINTNHLSTTYLSGRYLNTYDYGIVDEESTICSSYKDTLTLDEYYVSYNFNDFAWVGMNLGVTINGQKYQGNNYHAGEGPGFYTGSEYINNFDYCYFSEGCVLRKVDDNTCYLYVNSYTYNNLTFDDYMYKTTQTSSSSDGQVFVHGTLHVDGNTVPDKGMIYCNGLYKNNYWDNPELAFHATFNMHMQDGNDSGMESYWQAESSGYYTCTKEYNISPFDYVYIYWDSPDVSGTTVIINAEDWWIDSSNNGFGFNIFSNTGVNAQPISVWYTTTDRQFHMWEDAQTGNAIPISMNIYYCKANGVGTRVVIQNTNDGNYTNPRKTISTPGCTAMTDSNSSLVLSPQKIQIGNPGDSTGTTVTINRNSITIGNTTINEAQLQALLAMITNPPAPATLGVMSIVE